jgi:hypothetical protein
LLKTSAILLRKKKALVADMPPPTPNQISPPAQVIQQAKKITGTGATPGAALKDVFNNILSGSKGLHKQDLQDSAKASQDCLTKLASYGEKLKPYFQKGSGGYTASFPDQLVQSIINMYEKCPGDNVRGPNTSTLEGEMANLDNWVAANPGGGFQSTHTENGKTETLGHINDPYATPKK